MTHPLALVPYKPDQVSPVINELVPDDQDIGSIVAICFGGYKSFIRGHKISAAYVREDILENMSPDERKGLEEAMGIVMPLSEFAAINRKALQLERYMSVVRISGSENRVILYDDPKFHMC